MRWIICLFMLLRFASSAFAGEVERADMELLFLQGRLNELDAAADKTDPWCGFMLLVRDHYWQRSPGPIPALDPKSDALLAQRLRWLQGEVAYTASSRDPVPILSALIRDRETRESQSPQGARASGVALRTMELTGEAGRALDQGLWALDVHQAFVPSPDDAKSVARAERLASRNAWIGIVALLVMLIGVAIGGYLLRGGGATDESTR